MIAKDARTATCVVYVNGESVWKSTVRTMGRELEKIIERLNKNEWRIAFDQRMPCAGEVDDYNEIGIIYINPLQGDRVVTLIHECLHLNHPSYSEDRIEALAESTYRGLSRDEEEILLYYLRAFRSFV